MAESPQQPSSLPKMPKLTYRLEGSGQSHCHLLPVHQGGTADVEEYSALIFGQRFIPRSFAQWRADGHQSRVELFSYSGRLAKPGQFRFRQHLVLSHADNLGHMLDQTGNAPCSTCWYRPNSGGQSPLGQRLIVRGSGGRLAWTPPAAMASARPLPFGLCQ